MQGDVFCHQSECTVSGEDNLIEGCPLCNELVFCSQTCKVKKRGLYEHIEKYCEKKRNYTPRSVLSRIMDAIENSSFAKKDLLERFKNGKKTPRSAHDGVMYIVVQDMDTACTMLNSTITDVGMLMASLAVFTPLYKVDPSLRERADTLLLLKEGSSALQKPFFLLAIRAERQGSVIHKIYV